MSVQRRWINHLCKIYQISFHGTGRVIRYLNIYTLFKILSNEKSKTFVYQSCVLNSHTNEDRRNIKNVESFKLFLALECSRECDGRARP